MKIDIGVAAIVASAALLVSCAAPVRQPEQSGFLSDYSGLQKVEGNRLLFASGKMGQYSGFIIDPVMMLYRPPEEDRMFSDKELTGLQEYFHKSAEEALTKGDGYEVVSDPGPGVARLRIAITDVDDTVGVLNVTMYTKITGAGLGGLAGEGELVDAVTGEQIVAAIRWGSGSRVLRAGYKHTGDAEILICRWTKQLRAELDAAHGRETSSGFSFC
jgi:hypothetical protein